MASELDKLLVKMGLKEEKPRQALTLPASAIGGGLAASGTVSAMLANPNDFGGAGRSLWKDLLRKNPSNIRGLEALAGMPRGKRNAAVFKNVGGPMAKTSLKMAIPAALIGLGIDAFSDDTEWNDPDELVEKVKRRMK